MKRIPIKARYLLYPLILFAMIFATFEYANITASAATCCEYGNQCPPGKGRVPVLRCCNPGIWEADCSQTRRNYCRESCG